MLGERAMDLVKQIYRATTEFPKEESYSLITQISPHLKRQKWVFAAFTHRKPFRQIHLARIARITRMEFSTGKTKASWFFQ